MTTKDSTENMPDVIYAGFTEIAKGPVWFPEKKHEALEYYSQAELDRRVADLEHRLKCSEIARQELVKEIEQLTSEVAGLKIRKFTHFSNEECWIYDPHGENNLDSLVCPVVISPSDLQNVVAEAEERQRERCKDVYLAATTLPHVRSNVARAILNAGGKGDE